MSTRDRPAGRAAPVRLALAPVVAARLAYAACHPPRRAARDPNRPGFATEEVAVPAGAGRALSGWLCPGDPARIVVVGHGLGQDKARSVRYARFLSDAGYTVLMFDFRNHGASFDDRALTGYHRRFGQDVEAVVRWARARSAGPGTRVALYGFSLASFAMLHAVAGLPDPVHAVICDSGPSDRPAGTADNLLRSGLLPVPPMPPASLAYRLLAATYRRLSAVTMGWPAPWPPTAAQPRYADTPLLFVTGDADRLVPSAEVRRVAAGCPRAEVVVIPGAAHMKTMTAAPQTYTGAVLDFLARAIGVPGRDR
ncbi:alpha/beta hydrolase [Jidongwangia harbinensis]|uniref:alpha/beta hydrolase n=1 Tax=Jidongwangia harbinensis TaxID=2878561 RepID=UPI001CD963FF|nr:alpha/beta fold hydrolase [Jidongwangia harbinensis]MCA2218263.1 alpha/beta fold hydrolase [Jidongwangia harbinensis]